LTKNNEALVYDRVSPPCTSEHIHSHRHGSAPPSRVEGTSSPWYIYQSMTRIASLAACACPRVHRGRGGNLRLRRRPDKDVRRMCGHICRSSRKPTVCRGAERWAGCGGDRYVKSIGSGAQWRPRSSLPPSIIFSCCSASLALVLLVLSHLRRGPGAWAGTRAEMHDLVRRTGPITWSRAEQDESLDNRAGRDRISRGAMQKPTPPPGVSYSSVGPSFPGSTSLASHAFKMHMDALDPGPCAEDIIET